MLPGHDGRVSDRGLVAGAAASVARRDRARPRRRVAAPGGARRPVRPGGGDRHRAGDALARRPGRPAGARARGEDPGRRRARAAPLPRPRRAHDHRAHDRDRARADGQATDTAGGDPRGVRRRGADGRGALSVRPALDTPLGAGQRAAAGDLLTRPRPAVRVWSDGAGAGDRADARSAPGRRRPAGDPTTTVRRSVAVPGADRARDRPGLARAGRRSVPSPRGWERRLGSRWGAGCSPGARANGRSAARPTASCSAPTVAGNR